MSYAGAGDWLFGNMQKVQFHILQLLIVFI